MQDTVPTTASVEPGTVHVEPRTITYPIKMGGTLTAVCPTWCTTDHADDVACGIHPSDLVHQGDDIHLDFNAGGVETTILQARIGQFPFSGDPDEATPYVELTPEGSLAVSVYCYNRLQLDDEIRRVRAHLRALIELGDQLSEAQAEDHARHTVGTDKAKAWLSFSRADVMSMPVAYLLKSFGVTVVETEDTGRPALVALYGEPGSMDLRVKPDTPQHLREDLTRRALADWFETQLAANRRNDVAGA